MTTSCSARIWPDTPNAPPPEDAPMELLQRTLDGLLEAGPYALIGLGLIFAAALAYRWAQEPKIERQLYGCTARWDAKAQTCRGKWVPLYEQQP